MATQYIGEVELSGKGDIRSTQERYTRVFDVESDDPEESEKTVATCAGLPNLGDGHDANGAAKCIALIPERHEDSYHWRVTAQYETPAGSAGSLAQQYTDPCSAPAQITIDTEAYEEVVDLAYQGGDTQDAPTEQVVNSAGDPFDPPLMRPVYVFVIRIVQNERFVTASDIMNLSNTLNTSSHTIAGITVNAYEGHLRRFSPQKMWDASGSSYYQVTYEIVVDKRGHRKRVLDAGYRILDGGEPRVLMQSDVCSAITAKSKDDIPVTEPHKLDGAGGLSAGASSYLTFQTIYATSWSALSLPSSL